MGGTISFKRKCIFLIVMAAVFVVCAVGIAEAQGDSEESVSKEHTDKLSISADSGFYAEDLRVIISAPRGTEVYYTLDCGEPTPGSGLPYRDAISFRAEEEAQLYVLRVKGYGADGTESEIYTRSYFCGSNIADRYDSLVLSMVGEPELLFGYEEGILVPGAWYDAFMEEHPDIHPGADIQANYTMRGREAEREVLLEMFDEEGQTLFTQMGGVRVMGEMSRRNNHKNLRLYARREYDEQNKFSYDFFGDLYSLEDGTLGQEYKRLLLKNCGQDYAYGFVRGELVGRLADQAGFPDTQHVRPVCVYINRIYYGSYWLTSNYDGQYFENRYGAYDGEFVILEGGDRIKQVSDDSDQEEAERAEEFNAKYDAFSKADLTDDANYRELQEFLDVENYLQYFAIENYVGNFDWPDSNLRTYRYVAGESGYQEDSVFDGRYRMLLYDVEYGFGLMFYYGTLGTLANKMTLDKILYESSPLFAALMQREDCREYFTSYTLDLMNGVMRAENVAEQVDALHASRRDELARMYAVEGLIGGTLLGDVPLEMGTVESNIQQIRVYAQERPQYVYQDIYEQFGYGQQYKMTVVSENVMSSVKVNSVYCGDDTFVGTYLKELPVTLTPCLSPNEVFDCWLVNGAAHQEQELVLQGSAIEGDEVEVRLVTRELDSPLLQIAEVAGRGQEDYVTLINLSTQDINTKGYYLSDSEDMYRYALPVMVLKPEESVRLVGKDNDSAESLGEYVLNFNLKEGETLSLTYMSEIIDIVTLPKLSRDGVYVRDFQRNIYIEHKREQ
ncbi:MAG: CotH kinase family protein [Butyrivibrio sp.]|nr:CotH kinase family protein [Butyrivibrio sp.]